MASSPASAGASGLLGGHGRVPPQVVDVEGHLMLHDRERVVQELRHARAERLHGGQRPCGSLREALVVRFDAGVVLQRRQRGHVDHGPQLCPSAFRDRGATGALATLSSRRLEARQLDQLSTVTITTKGADFRDQGGHRDPAKTRERAQVRGFRNGLQEPLQRYCQVEATSGRVGR